MKNAWHRFQRYYFSFNRSDRNAVIILLGILVLVIIAKSVLPMIIPEHHTDFTQIKAAFEKREKEKSISSSRIKLHLFAFDPNTITEPAMDSLDLPAFVKQNIIRYRGAGGRFTSPEDIRKIYGMSDSIFLVIQPYIQVEEHISAKKVKSLSFSNAPVRNSSDSFKRSNNGEAKYDISIHNSIELNKADSATLVSLPGIGPVFSKRILKYRKLLGGFYKKEQLLEVYNFPAETYNSLSEYLQVDTLEIKKLRINFLDFSELLRHPYLNKTQVTAIIQRRESLGPFKNISEVAAIEAFDSETFARARPYLSCR